MGQNIIIYVYSLEIFTSNRKRSVKINVWFLKALCGLWYLGVFFQYLQEARQGARQTMVTLKYASKQKQSTLNNVSCDLILSCTGQYIVHYHTKPLYLRQIFHSIPVFLYHHYTKSDYKLNND